MGPGSHPWLFFFHGSLGPVPGCLSLYKSMWHVFHQSFHSCLWDSADSCSKHALLNASLALLGIASPSHVTRLCFPSWSAGCVLRRWLLMSGSTLTPILGFGSRVSLALVCSCPPDCEFLVVVVHLMLLSRCSVRDFFSGLFLQLHLVVVYSDVACGWSLQHCCAVPCYDVVDGPAPLR